MKTTNTLRNRTLAALCLSAVATGCIAPGESRNPIDAADRSIGEKALNADVAAAIAAWHRAPIGSPARMSPKPETGALAIDGDLGRFDWDGDGVPKNLDLCPGTPAGQAVNARGCAAAQSDPVEIRREAAAAAEAAGAPLPLPADGQSAVEGFTNLVVDRASNNPLVFWVRDELITAIDNGFAVEGSLQLELPGGEMLTFAEASLIFERAADGSIDTVHGTARLPFPAGGLVEGLEFADLAQVEVGYDYGRNLQDLEAPINDDQKYLFFSFSVGFEASAGPVSLSMPDGQSATIVLDPADPMIYFRGNLGGVSGLGPIEDMGIGLSWQGLIPFTPHLTFGMDDADAAGFEGNVYLAGTVDIPRLPLAVTGEIVADMDPNGEGRSLFDVAVDDMGFQYGSNGTLSLTADFLQFLSFDLELARSSMIYRVDGDGASAVFSGQISPDQSWMPSQVPLRASQAVQVAGKLSTDIADSYVRLHGNYTLDLSGLGALSGLDLSELFMADATVDIDQDGFHLVGVSNTSFAPGIGLNGEAQVEAFFGDNPDDWRVTIDGDLVIKGIDLGAQGHAEITSAGASVSGFFETPVGGVNLTGTLDRNGIALDGQANLSIPIVAGHEVAQRVTDAAVCGYETVTDAAICGSRIVTDAAICGSHYVVDGALCGVHAVTDAAVCGSHMVADGAVCGYDTVRDAAVCGTETVIDWACQAACSIFGCDCSSVQARSCQIPRSCNIANTCNVANGCNIASSCSVAATCDRIATCEQHVTVPEWNYGTVGGVANLHLSNSGLSVAVDADYCLTDGTCTAVGGGRLDLSSSPRVCVQVPGLGQEFCAGI